MDPGTLFALGIVVFAAMPAGLNGQVCPDDYETFVADGYTTCLRFSEDRQNYQTASQTCKNEGARLVVIKSAALDTAIDNRIRSTYAANTWIGLDDLTDPANQYQWSDGSVLAAGDFHDWNPGQPDTIYREKCGEIRQVFGYKWNNFECHLLQNYICEKVCPNGWRRFQQSCYLIQTTPKSWQDARTECGRFQADLVSVNTADEQRWVAAQIQVNSVSDHYWIGLNDIVTEGSWTWVDGTDLSVPYWVNNHEPNNLNNEDCVEVVSNDGLWNDFACSGRRQYICEKRDVCRHPLGMESGAIPDGSITASSQFIAGNLYRTSLARLNEVADAGAWSALQNTVGQWLQVDLGEIKYVTGTIIQGRHTLDQWVTSYKLVYSTDGTNWHTYTSNDGSEQVFAGNTDRHTPVTNLLDFPVTARYVRFVVQTWHGWISMRAEVLGCSISRDVVERTTPSPVATTQLTTLQTTVPTTDYTTSFTTSQPDEEGLTPPGSNRYKFLEATVVTFVEAKARCKAEGATLAMPKDQAAHDLLVQYRNGVNSGITIWIGLNDIQSEGDFVWEDGASLGSLSRWFPGQPNNGNNAQHCAVLTPETNPFPNQWRDDDCTATWRVICERGLFDLVFTDVEVGYVSMSWRVSPGLVITGYRVRYQHAGASYKDLSPPPAAGGNTATVSGLWADTEYTFTVTSFGENGEINGEVSGTVTTAEVLVNVVCNQAEMQVSIPKAALPGVKFDEIHLLDSSCVATEGPTVVTLVTELQKCGTIQEVTAPDKFTFINEIIGEQVIFDNGAVRGTPFRKRFQCEFLRQDLVSGGAILYNIPLPRFTIVEADNSFIFDMHMFTSEDFSATYGSPDFPVRVTSADHLHFGLSVNSPLDNLELFALQCVATQTMDPEDSPQVSIIHDGCDIDATLTLDSARSTDTALYYSIEAFTFPNVNVPTLVYLHCTVLVCFKDDPDSRCSEGCISARRRRRALSDWSQARVRRESIHDREAVITQGPFVVDPEAKKGSAFPTVGVAIGVVGGLAGLLLLVAAVVLVRNRRGRVAKEKTDDRIGLDNYSFQMWGREKAGHPNTKI